MEKVLLYCILFVTVLNASNGDVEQEKLFGKICDFFNRSKEGSITKNNIDHVLPKLGKSGNDCDRHSLIKEYDEDRDGKLDDDEHKTLLDKFSLELFHLFDKENKGYITNSELKKILNTTQQDYTEQEIDGMIRNLGTEQSGKITLEIFKRRALMF